ncbi:hypothetical protein D3C86_1105600 [compost metagenome]
MSTNVRKCPGLLGYAEAGREVELTKSASDLGDRWTVIATVGAKENEWRRFSGRFECRKPVEGFGA